MNKQHMKPVNFFALIIFIFLVPKLIAQNEHQPEFFGIFIDSPKELVEINEPIKNKVNLNKEELNYDLKDKWEPQRIWLTGTLTIILYGDEYSATEVGLYKCTSIIPEFATSGNFTFNEIKLKAGPIAGLAAKAYKLIAGERLREGDYFLRYGSNFYPILISRIRSSNPIEDTFYDMTITNDGTIILATDNGMYMKKKDVWDFKEMRGSEPKMLFRRYDEKCAFFCLDDAYKNVVRYTTDGGESFKDYTIEELGGSVGRINLRDMTITGIVGCPQIPSLFYFFGIAKDTDRKRDQGFAGSLDKVGDKYEFERFYKEPVLWLVVDPSSCTNARIGTTESMYYTTNFGGDWEDLKEIIADPVKSVNFAGFGPKTENDFYNTRDALYIFDEGTSKFISTSWNYGRIHNYYWDETTLLIASEQGLFESKDGGMNWEKLSKTIKLPNIIKVVVDIQDKNKIYALTEDQLYMSLDRGKTWTIE